MNSSVAGPSSAIVYFESIPSPRNNPTPHHARPSPSQNTRARKDRVATQQTVSGASGVMIQPIRKKYGRHWTSPTATTAVRPSRNSVLVSRHVKNDVASEHSNAPTRTPHSPCPNAVVPSQINHATIGGWSR